MHHVQKIVVAVCLMSCLGVTVEAADWAQFRGPQGNGVATGESFPTSWGSEKNIKWKVSLPAAANGSPIVSGGRVFLTCAADEGKERSLYCFDRTDGKKLWVKTVDFGKAMPTHPQNPHGSSTPAADGKRVVVWHGSAGLHCYDFAGKQLWSRDLGEFKHQWGYGSSPVIYKDQIILHCGPGKRVFLTAIDLAGGKTVWETDEPQDGDGEKRADGGDMGSWSTPVIAQVDGKDQIVCAMSTRVNGYDPQTGELIWSCDGLSGSRYDVVSSSPLVADGFCVATAGFRGPSIGLKMGGKGNITKSNRRWLETRNPESIGSGVFLGKYIYRPNAKPGTLECLAAETGESQWSDRAAGRDHWGSMVLAGGNLYAINQRGTTVVFKPNPKEFEEVGSNDLGESTNATPAFSDGQIFIRTDEHLFCIGK